MQSSQMVVGSDYFDRSKHGEYQGAPRYHQKTLTGGKTPEDLYEVNLDSSFWTPRQRPTEAMERTHQWGAEPSVAWRPRRRDAAVKRTPVPLYLFEKAFDSISREISLGNLWGSMESHKKYYTSFGESTKISNENEEPKETLRIYWSAFLFDKNA